MCLVGLVLVDLGTGKKPVLLYAVLNMAGFSGYTCRVDIVLDGLRVFKDGNFVAVVAAIFLFYFPMSCRSLFVGSGLSYYTFRGSVYFSAVYSVFS